MTSKAMKNETHPGYCPGFVERWMRVRYASLLVLVSVLSTGSAFGQIPVPKGITSGLGVSQNVQPQPAEATPQDPLGRDTPYGTVVGFLKAAEQGDWEHASEFLDSKQPPAKKQTLARQLKLVLDRGLALDLNTISKSPQGAPVEKWRVTRNEIGTARIGDQSLVILLDRIQPTGRRPPYWLFSAETLAGVPAVAHNLEAPWFDAYIPKVLLENQLLGIPVFRWIAVPLLTSIAFAFVWMLTWLFSLLIRGIFRLAHMSPIVLRAGFLNPVRVLILGYLVYTVAPLANTLVDRQRWRHIATAVMIAGFAWFLTRTVDLAAEIAAARFRRKNSLHRIASLQLYRWIIKALVAVTSLAVILYAVGINPTTVVTGLGLGGIALAFAAQKTIENVFGTVMIVVDQPVRVGDFCKIGDSLGTIEDIGLRSTRVRTLDRTVLTVPNGQLAAMMLENYTPRERIWFHHVIGLRYETTADQIRYVLAEIRTLLQKHPKVDSNTARVRFIRFGGSSLDLEIFAYVMLTDFEAFLAVQEELLLRTMDIIAGSGTSIALPSQTTYLAKDRGLDAEKSQAAVEQVRRARDQVAVS